MQAAHPETHLSSFGPVRPDKCGLLRAKTAFPLEFMRISIWLFSKN